MLSQAYYLIRSSHDGRYLVAQVEADSDKAASGYLLMFHEHADALSYLNTHAAKVAARFGVESVTGNQLKSLLKRWGFSGVGMVQDPLVPSIEFLSVD